jgi:DNA polymerase
MTVAQLDFETASEAKLTGKDSVGAWRYAEHPSTRVLSLAYKIGDDRWRLWIPGWPWPKKLTAAVEAGYTFEAHNAQFEKAIWWHALPQHFLVKRMVLNASQQPYYWGRRWTPHNAPPYPTKWKCTLAACAHRALPQGLDKVGEVLQLPIQKDKRGKYLIQRLSRRHQLSKKWPTGWVRPDQAGPGPKSDPLRYSREAAGLLREMYSYNITDGETEEVLSATIGPLPESEQMVWEMNQAINERGIRVDLDAVDAAKEVFAEVTKKLTAELRDITGGFVQTHGQTAKMQEWLNHYKVFVPDMQADTLKDAVKDPQMPNYAKRLIEIRQTLSKTSIKKLDKITQCVMEDGRIRGMSQYHGASTGRDAGRLVQLLNLPRPDNDEIDMDDLIDLIKLRDVKQLEAGYGGSATQALSDAIRGMFIAAEGHTYQVGDYSAIEACIAAWAGNEEWKLQAFERGERIYSTTASMIFQRPINKKDNPKEDGVGKVCELAFGYQGGVGAWRGFDHSDTYTDEEINGYKDAWRAKHPGIVAAWHGMERAAGRAIVTGEAQTYKFVRYEPVVNRAGWWLMCVLPSGRRLWYFRPQCVLEDTKYGPKYHISYQGRNNKKGGSWCEVRTYGGMLFENWDQAVARDLLVNGMVRVEYAGYPIVLTVYDEIVAEVPLSFGSQKQFDREMGILPEWAAGLPLGVAGWRKPRYRKN